MWADYRPDPARCDRLGRGVSHSTRACSMQRKYCILFRVAEGVHVSPAHPDQVSCISLQFIRLT